MVTSPAASKTGAVSSDRTGPSSVLAQRIDLPGSLVGFLPPPHRTGLRFLPLTDRVTVLALTAPGRPVEIAAWFQQYLPETVTIGPGLAPKVLRATFRVLPASWKHLLSSVTVRHVLLTPDGCASLFVEDSLWNVSRFMDSLGQNWPMVRSRETNPDPSKTQLTHRQEEALSLAVALGYYEVPHKLNLRELGRRMNLSVGAVSELLRRGEAHLVTSHVDARTRGEWAGTDAPIQLPLPLLVPAPTGPTAAVPASLRRAASTPTSPESPRLADTGRKVDATTYPRPRTDNASE